MDLQPLGDRIIVEILDEEATTASGIVLPDTAQEKPQRGKVLAVGPGSRDEDGEYIKMDVAVGDEVIFSKYGGTEIKVGADDVLILRESHAVLHTWPETGMVNIDIFTCTTGLRSLAAIAELGQSLGAAAVSVQEIARADGHSPRSDPRR